MYKYTVGGDYTQGHGVTCPYFHNATMHNGENLSTVAHSLP